MSPSLHQIQTELAAARLLRHEAWTDVRDAFVRPRIFGLLSDDARRVMVATVVGYDRELEALAKVEREVLDSGRISPETLEPVLSRFDASGADSALLTGPTAPAAQKAPRETPRNDASAAPQPLSVAAGDGF